MMRQISLYEWAECQSKASGFNYFFFASSVERSTKSDLSESADSLPEDSEYEIN